MGYANEVGESFAAFLPSWGVAASYGVAAVYVCLAGPSTRSLLIST
jgi:hypothetical protein